MNSSPTNEVVALLALLSLALAAPASAQAKIAVMDVRVLSDVSKDVGQLLSEEIVADIRRQRPDAAVISADEIRSMMQVEVQKSKLGCDSKAEVACLAEIGGALGAERLVVGTLGKLGATYVYGLKLFDVNKAKVLASATVNVRTRDDSELLNATSKLVRDLFPTLVGMEPQTPPLEVSAAPAPSHSHLTSILLGAAGLVCAGFAVYGLTRVLAYNGDVSLINSHQEGKLTAQQLASDQSSAQLWQPLGIGLAVAAAGGAAGGVLTW